MGCCITITARNMVGPRITPINRALLKGLGSGMGRNMKIGIANIQIIGRILSASILTGVNTELVNIIMKIFITAIIMAMAVGNNLTEVKKKNMNTEVRG